MAFQTPTRARRQNLVLPRTETRDSTSTHQTDTFSNQISQKATTAADTEEWVVFSPSTAEGTGTHISRTSESGSVFTASSAHLISHGIEDTYDDEESDAESDTLSNQTDPLQAFANNTPVLFPAHDGLGTFSSNYTPRSLEHSLRIVEAASNTTDKTARIHKWRVEQSQAFMEEIERATRKRRLSLASRPPVVVEDSTDAPNESFWKRITRSFIRDIIGIDDALLEVLFGEALPEEAVQAETTQQRKNVEEKLLDRITQELGELVKLYSPSPAQGKPLATPIAEEPPASLEAAPLSPTSETPTIPFHPTIPTHDEVTHAALWGIEDTDVDAHLKKEYWEQDLDMRLVFSYVKSHFMRRSAKATAPSPPASVVETVGMRYQHPLVNRRRAATVLSAGTGRSRGSSRRGAYYWDVATSVGSGNSCVGTGVWAAI